MQRNSMYLIKPALWLLCASVFYFAGLVAALPFFLVLLLVVAACYAMERLWLRHLVLEDTLTATDRRVAVAVAVLVPAGGLFLARKYGDWDAVYIYNLAARLLQDPVHWRALFLYDDVYSHADYPLHIPAGVAFLQRLSGGGYKEWVPFVNGLFYTAAIPLLLFFETLRANRVLSLVLLVSLLLNTYFLNNGVIQCADVPLSFFVLLCFLAWQRLDDGMARGWGVLFGAGLGACIWTKNEGLLYALALLACALPLLWRRRLLGPVLLALLPGLLAWLLLKTVYAPANDLLGGRQSLAAVIPKLLDKERYKLIAAAFSRETKAYFLFPVLLAGIYLFYCVQRQLLPSCRFLPFLLFAAGLFAVYLLTPHDLAWHLDNSVSRILLQWYPAFLYVTATELAHLMPVLPARDGPKK